MGTATLIGRGLALTAGHVMAACKQAYGLRTTGEGEVEGDFRLYGCQHVGGEVRQFLIDMFFAQEQTDVAVLRLRLGEAEWLPTGFPRWTLLPPKIGERVFAFGYAGIATQDVDGNTLITRDARTSVGEVKEHHLGGRDRLLAPFPCFRTNNRFDDAMSGGPVFTEGGRLCGVICANLPPAQEGEEHSSLVSLLWPILGANVELLRADTTSDSSRLIDVMPRDNASIEGIDRVFVAGKLIGIDLTERLSSAEGPS
ncbi:hypothetical protein DSM104443_00936 [Usitatibacter rugosus]|uniref:Trypsin-like peptidase n=1 Tax=Usitatibacter rugosus TaxID=2732067 RepID=A0A6M4GS27_9PROT|nr:serine protease [Usitatibacter rugosus]QJR09886.1 hypothetical protein DSM104443_00936 [Usitatibacter rugosus]